MHVSSIYNIKTQRISLHLTRCCFLFLDFLLFSPFLVVGFRGKHNICIKNCHPRVTFIFQGDIELTLLVSYGVCVLCLDSRPEDLRKIKIFFLSGFLVQVLLNVTYFAKFE